MEKGQAGTRRCYYRAILRPSLHRLNYHSDSRIFQDQTVLDISKTILAENNVTDVDWRIEMDHQNREFCVQYGETSISFLRRIWAEEGIFYWFEHSATAHRMIISDAPLAMPMLAAAETLTYNNTSGGMGKGFWVHDFNQVERVRATNRVSKDYFFKRPAYPQQHSVGQYEANGAKGNYELYHYPGRHKFPSAGQPFNDYALEAHRVEATTADGATNNIQLSAGFVFALTDHPDPAANTNHRLLRVVHEGSQPAALEEDAGEDTATTYTASFVSQPSRLPYRPINPNPKPMVEGPQIAHITGPEGEEIYTDEHARVKIWFPWDRHGQKNEHSSCWVRVSQNWAGGNWGHMAIPRIGQEVVVDFLGGDPDQPIITGRTYNATNRPPYPLPEHKTRMTIKSNTHKGKGFNELRFEDEAGKEEVWMHAQKDHNTVIENDESHQIGHDRSKNVARNQIEAIGNNKSITVGHDHSESIGNNASVSVGNNQKKTVGKDLDQSVGNNVTQKIGNNVSRKIGASRFEEVGSDTSTKIGNSQYTEVKADKKTSIGGSVSEKISGRYDLVVSDTILGKTTKLKLSAGQKAEIVGPGGALTIDAQGVTIEANQINLKGALNITGGSAPGVEQVSGSSASSLDPTL
ncbi:MAG: type VI secretion system Vgr family protein, partial [Planktomarina sp.]